MSPGNLLEIIPADLLDTLNRDPQTLPSSLQGCLPACMQNLTAADYRADAGQINKQWQADYGLRQKLYDTNKY